MKSDFTPEQIHAIVEYVANICSSKRIAEIFGVSEEKVKDAIDRTDFLRRLDTVLADSTDNTQELDNLVLELAREIK